MSEIHVLAGVNGAGKSSVGGAMIQQAGVDFFNPDLVARSYREIGGLSEADANIAAWNLGRELLEKAIHTRTAYAFETTLGGETIASLLKSASDAGIHVMIWYVGLSNVALHLTRIRERVAAGGHDIPEQKVVERWRRSPENLMNLLPHLTELRLFDNSKGRDPKSGVIPPPTLLLHMKNGVIIDPADVSVDTTAIWARPIVVRALEIHRAL